jgi:hypothetical protein
MGDYARDKDGDGFHEVHVNTIEGFWSLLYSWLNPHRGISQEKLPGYLSFFEFVHNAKRCGESIDERIAGTIFTPDVGFTLKRNKSQPKYNKKSITNI